MKMKISILNISLPTGPSIMHEKLGDGCTIDFPIRLHSK